MRKAILLLSVLAILGLGWFLYFNPGENVTIVSVYKVKKSNLSNALEFSGEVSPTRMYSVMSETGGTVSDLLVSEGSRVDKNDVLLKLDDSQAQVQLKKAQLEYDALLDAQAQTVMAQGDTSVSELQKARVALALSQTTGYDYDALNSTFGSETAQAAVQASTSLAESLDELSDASSALAQTEAELESQIALAQLAVEQLQAAIDSTTYKSRIAGTVITLNIREGEVLAPGVPAMVIADTDNTVVTGYVYEKDVEDLEMGMDAAIIADGRTYRGTLTSIGSAATGVGDVSAFDTMTKIEITPEDGFKKMIGAMVDLEIVLSSRQNVLSVPLDCLTDDGCVFVVDDEGIVQKRAIVTGFEDNTNAQVLGGLSEGELVVSTPKNLQEGQKVSYDRG